jgi:hypothetical protein
MRLEAAEKWQHRVRILIAVWADFDHGARKVARRPTEIKLDFAAAQCQFAAMILIRASLLAAILAVLAGCACLPGSQSQGLSAADADEVPLTRRDEVGQGSEL